MIDRERVIKGLGNVANAIVDGYICEPDQAVNTIADALAILKEQEAVEPIKMQRMDGNFSFFVPYYLCGNCRYELVGKDVMFCHHCGRSVKWNE